MTDTVDKVGLGVDLVGGSSTLSELKAIRAEMEAIAALGGKGSGGARGSIYGPTQQDASKVEQFRRANEQAEMDSIRRLAKAKAEAYRYIDPEEPAALNATIARKREVQRRANQLAQQELITTAEVNRRINDRGAKDAQARQEQEARGYARLRQILDVNTRKNRDDIVAEGKLREEQLRKYTALRRQQANELASDPNAFVGRDPLIRSQLNEARLRPIYGRDPAIQSTRDDTALQLRALRIKRDNQRKFDAEEITALRTKLSEEESIQLAATARLSRRLAQGREGSLPIGATGRGSPSANTRAFRAHLAAGGTAANFNPNGPPGGKPPGGDDEEESGGGSSGGLGVVGRLARNFIIYRALTTLTFGVINYTRESLAAAKATSEQANALKFATEAAHGNLEANRALANQLGEYGYNRAQANEVVATAARATFRHPEQTAALAREATNIAALRGGGLQEANKVIEDIIGGRDRPYREYFNTTPEEIYKEAAQKKIAGQTQLLGFHGIGKQVYETQTQQISRYVSALSEEEKETLRLNYVLSQSGRFQGDAAERAATLAGKMDLVSAAFFNASANVGAFIADITPVKSLLDQIASGAGLAGIFNPPQLRQSGPGNVTTANDVSAYGIASTTGPRAELLRRVSAVANPVTTLFNSSIIGPFLAKLLRNSSGGPGELAVQQFGAENVAQAARVKQLNDLRGQGQLGYRPLNPTAGNYGYSSYEELRARGISGGDILKNYIEEVKPAATESTKALYAYQQKRKELLADIAKGGIGLGSNSLNQARTRLNRVYALDASNDSAFLEKFKPENYDVEAQKREDDRRAKELEKHQKDVNELALAQAKLRDARAGSFKLVGEIATSITGEDNPFTKILADQITAAERMRQQWGFLGQDAVKYFTTLEQNAQKRNLNQAEFGAYTTSSNLLFKSGQERAARQDPTTLSRKEQEYLNIQSTIVDKALQIPRLWNQAAEILDRTVDPTTELVSKVDLLTRAFGVRGPATGFGNIFKTDLTKESALSRQGLGNPIFSGIGQLSEFARTGNPLFLPGGQDSFQRQLGNPNFIPTNAQTFAGLGKGQSEEVQQALRKSFADSLIETFKDYSPQQIRDSGLQSYYLGAIGLQTQALGYNIQQAQAKAQLGAIEDVRLRNQLAEDAKFRDSQLAKGYDAGDVGKASDRLLLARTDNIPTKDLTFDQFQARQEAQRREAERAVSDQEEARKATILSVGYQKQMAETLTVLGQKLLGGDFSVLMQIQNDTQARVDKENLEEATSGRYNVNLDQRGVKSSAYTPSTEKYKRKGGQ